MPEPPLLRPRQVIKILEGEGFRWRNSRGTDRVYKRVTESGSRTVTVPTHPKQIARGTLRSLLRQAGWTREEFLELVERYR